MDALVAERVWQETEKALREPRRGALFSRCCASAARSGASIPKSTHCSASAAPAQWHPEIDTGVHTLMVLDQAVTPEPRCAGAICRAGSRSRQGRDAARRMAEPSRPRGAQRRADRIAGRAAARPGGYRELAVIVARYHGIVHRAFELKPRTVLEFLEQADAFRRPERFAQALLACEADSRGRSGWENEALSAARLPARAREPRRHRSSRRARRSARPAPAPAIAEQLAPPAGGSRSTRCAAVRGRVDELA